MQDIEQKMHATFEAFQKNLSSIRAGRASPNLLDKIQVEVYGSFMPLNQVATVSVVDNNMLSVQVWDQGNSGVAEKAIRTSDLGLNPSAEGNVIRVPLPKLSEERREELVKICASYAEQAKVSLRNIRRDSNDALKKQQKDSDISEDEMHDKMSEIDKKTESHVKEIDGKMQAKKIEILSV
jgi:ribosome recycling factor